MQEQFNTESLANQKVSRILLYATHILQYDTIYNMVDTFLS